jgi:hypothetical protein
MTDERRDDETLGRALARAIETIDLNETPFERSRIATTPARQGFFGIWQIGGAAAAILLAVALGSWFLRPTEEQPPVGSSPTPSASASPTPTSTPVATVPPGQLDRFKVYFGRDGLPPIGAHVDNAGIGASAAERIFSRLNSLPGASAPAGAVNAFPRGAQAPTLKDASSVKINGDVVTVDYSVPNGDWGVRGSASSLALQQQLVYTASEEPGIRRVLVTQNGQPAQIDQIVWDNPLTREEVFGYTAAGTRDRAAGNGATGGAIHTLTTRTSADQLAPGLARVVIEVAQGPSDEHPDFNVSVLQNDEASKPLGAKWILQVTVARSQDTTTGTRIIDRTPLRSLVAGQAVGSQMAVYEIGLDDLRPWRTALMFNPVRIIIDIGGAPSSISGQNAVYSPTPGATVARTFTVSGVAHNFEANVVIRVRNAQGAEVYKGNTTATNCCDPGGTFEASVTLPASVSGNVTLEVLEASAKDGSDLKVIRIPLTVR